MDFSKINPRIAAAANDDSPEVLKNALAQALRELLDMDEYLVWHSIQERGQYTKLIEQLEAAK